MKSVLAYLLFAVCLTGGCRTTVSGGTAKRDTGAFVAEVPTPAGIVVIRDDRELVASTQPSVETNTRHLPQVGAAAEGELGSITFQQVKTRGMAGGFLLSAVFAAVGVFAWFVLRRPVVAILCGALAVVSLLFPLWIGIGALVVAVGTVLYLTNGHVRRIVGSVSHAIDETLPPEVAAQFKGSLKKGQDHTDARIVAAAKPPGA